jgi:hypothetical protein
VTVLTMRAAEVGWTIFSVGPSRPSLDDINHELANRGLPSVSTRMYDHYQRLARRGHEHYMPINELDMSIKVERRRERQERTD